MHKHHLMSATALSLALAALTGLSVSVSGANAATTISTATTAPVATSTTGDLTLDSAGTITLTSGNAVTVDSDNTVTLNGVINMSGSADNSTGVLISGGHTSGLAIASNITVTDNYTATDTLPSGALDGIVDYPFATGTGRYGIHSMGTTPFNGNVSISAGTIQVEGNNSYGIRFENNLNGTLTTKGAITMLGDNNTGISLEKGATGNLYLSGSISVQGQNSRAVSLAGDFGGNIIIDGTYQGTGYAVNSISTLTAAQLAALPANDMLQGGALVTISGNVAKGVLINRVPTTDSTNTSTDQDGDGITDSTQATASLLQYGAAPALLIGGASNITLGGLDYASTAVSPPTVHYGLLVRGSISAGGVFSGIAPTAVQIGGQGGTVNIANGIGIYGGVSASGYEANATGLILKSGASTPQLDVNGVSLSAQASADATVKNSTAVALDIASGASLPTINIAVNSSIAATGVGSTSNATAIRDASNTLTAINNNNVITATISASDDDADGVADAIQHRAVAIDTHTNTTGLTLTQTDTAPSDDTIAAPYIIGDILLGSGNDKIVENGGLISGNIDFGAGANSFTQTGAASYLGKMTGTGTVALDVGTGALALTDGSSLNLTSLHVGSTGSLGLTLDTKNPTKAIFTNSGSAVFDNGASLNIALNNVLTSPQTFTVMTAAGGISLGNITTTTLDGHVPYIYHADLSTNTGSTTLFANFRLKSQAEGQFSNNEYAAFVPVLNAIGGVDSSSAGDAGGIAALTAALTKDSFDKVFNQYLPDYSGENLLTMARGAEALTQSLGNLTMIPDNNGGQYWLQEYGFKTTRKRGDTAGFDATGFAFAGGRERRLTDAQMLGVYLSYTTATPLDNFAIAKENQVASDVTVGGYWRIREGAFKGWAHAGVGFVQLESTRELLNTYVSHIATARWNGFSYSAGLGASVNYKAGFFNLTPQVQADIYGLNEDKHSETGGGDYFNLDVASRNSNLASAQAVINFSYSRWFVKPELWAGFKQNVSAKIANTVANFKGGTAFTLNGGDVTGGGPVAGFRISADNQYSYFSLEGEYSKLDAYTDYSLALRTRFQF